MSWRTKGQYLNLSGSDKEWLNRFDRDWDTKSCGRSRTDAFDSAGTAKLFSDKIQVTMSGSAGIDSDFRALLEANFLTIARRIKRFTVPKQTKVGWSIHLVLKCGKRARVHFEDFGSALHVYNELAEVSQWFCSS